MLNKSLKFGRKGVSGHAKYSVRLSPSIVQRSDLCHTHINIHAFVTCKPCIEHNING